MSAKLLPPGWRRVRLGDVLRQVNRFEALDPEKEYRLLGIKWYAGGVFERERKLGREIAANQLNRVQRGDFIYNRLFAWKGSFAVADDGFDGGYVSGEFPVFRAKGDDLNEEYLYLHFSRATLWKQIEHQSTGTTKVSRNRWREEQLLSSWISLPPPAYQGQVVDAIRSIEKAIAENERTVHGSEVLKTALVSQVLTKGATKSNWTTVQLGEVAAIHNGSTPSRDRKEYWENGTIAWLPTTKVNDRVIRSSDAFITKKALEECSLSLLPPGTVLIAMIGQGKTRGLVAFLDMEACVNQNFASIEPERDRLDPWFLFYRLEHDYLSLRQLGHGTNQDALNCRLLKRVTIQLPPLDEQRRIARFLSIVDDRLEAAQDVVRRLSALRENLIHTLTSGVRDAAH